MINDPKTLSGAVLAYYGDAVLELLARRRLIGSGISDVGKLNQMAARFVRATVQSEAVERLLPLLTEEENDLFRRGRNAHGVSIPKSASALEYRRATGMEALFAFLALSGREERMNELFAAAFPETE